MAVVRANRRVSSTDAMKSMVAIIAEPGAPKRCVATAGGTRPRPASDAVIGSCRAVDERPMDVASVNGIVNHTRPPRR